MKKIAKRYSRKVWLGTLILAVGVAASACVSESEQNTNQQLLLSYSSPATIWQESLPVGNGRLGAMPWGGVESERIVLNEESMWCGSPQQTANPKAVGYLPKIRELLLEGCNLEAQRVMYEHFTCAGEGSSTPQYGSYQTLGEMNLKFRLPEGEVENYERQLSLRDALATTRFEIGRVGYNYTVFASMAENVIVVRLEAEGGEVDVEVGLARPENATFRTGEEAVVMYGELPSYSEWPNLGYYARAEIVGASSVEPQEGDVLRARGKEVTIILSAATTYNHSDPKEYVLGEIESARRPYKALLADHITTHRSLFDRVEIDLGEQPSNITTPQRLEKVAAGEADAPLAALYAQYGRYLLIGSAYKATLPPNLQGIWADGVWCPWNGDYHLNINQQMNHWGAEVGNLAELTEPLTAYVKRLAESGKESAEVFYGADGWCAHVLANAWGFTAPSEDPSWGATNTGGAWLALHLWEHYLYTLDEDYLRDVYPLLRGAAEFMEDCLIEEREHGWLVTAPTTSPENGFYMDQDSSEVVYVCMGSTMDNQITRVLFRAVADAAEVLGVDGEYASQLRELVLRLPPNRIASDGRLMEWLEEYREMDPYHRHVSHLFGLYPAGEINRSTPELIEACRKSLEVRGDAGTGWSRAWKICLWARMGDGNRAHKLLRSLLEPAVVEWGHRGGTFPNLFCSHPPFQIDGNFGGSAGIMEMLLQSHAGCVELLPALPDEWSREGSFRGLRARGGIEVGCRWQEGRVVELTLCSLRDGTVDVVANGATRSIKLKAGREKTIRF